VSLSSPDTIQTALSLAADSILHTRRLRFDSTYWKLLFQFTYSFQPHDCSGVDSTSSSNQSQKTSCWYRALGMQGREYYRRLVADVLEIVGASAASYMDSYTFPFLSITVLNTSIFSHTLLCWDRNDELMYKHYSSVLIVKFNLNLFVYCL
jgi:hypothetical protein